jgi:hypothetical protein
LITKKVISSHIFVTNRNVVKNSVLRTSHRYINTKLMTTIVLNVISKIAKKHLKTFVIYAFTKKHTEFKNMFAIGMTANVNSLIINL